MRLILVTAAMVTAATSSLAQTRNIDAVFRAVSEARYVSVAVERHCPTYGTTLHPRLVEKIESDEGATLDDKQTRAKVDAMFRLNRDRACQLAYELYGPAGSMVDVVASHSPGSGPRYLVTRRRVQSFEDEFLRLENADANPLRQR